MPKAPASPLEETKAPPPPADGESYALKLASEISEQRLNLYRLTRPNHLLTLNPEKLRDFHQQFWRGYLYYATQLWDQMEHNDATLSSVIGKRKKDCARLDWAILADDKSAEAMRQKETLEYTYKNLRVTNAFDENVRGGVPLLVRQILDCLAKKYSAHELVWTPLSQNSSKGGARIGLEARFVPAWFFENWVGRLRYVNQTGGFYGTEMDPGGWLVSATETPLMQATAIAYLYKHYPLGDWLMYCDRYGMPSVFAKTDATPGSAQWEANMQAIENVRSASAGLGTRDTDLQLLEFKGAGELAYPKLVEQMDRYIATLWRGADQGTHSKENSTGASLQQNETDILLEDDAELITEVCQKQIDRLVLGWAFGPDVEVKARFHLLTPDRRDAMAIRSNLALAFNMGLPVSRSQVQELLGLEEPEDEADTLLKPAQTQDDSFDQQIEKPLTPKEDAANAAKATAPETGEDFLNAAADHCGQAMALDFANLRAAVDKIDGMSDPALQKVALARLRATLPGETKRLARKTHLSEAIADTLATSLINGVIDGGKMRRGGAAANEDPPADAQAPDDGSGIKFTKPAPFREAIKAQRVRKGLLNTLSTAQLEKLGPAILQRSLFMAGVSNARIVAAMDEIIGDILEGRMGVTEGMKHLQAAIRSTGYQPKEGDEGTLKDLRSLARRRLVLDTNVELLRGRGQWIQGQDTDLLKQWPVMELVRGRQAMNPRPWREEKWPAAAAACDPRALEVFKATGRMVARKDSPIWTLPIDQGGFNRFGVPWAPFDFGSGMITIDTEAADAVALGIIDADDDAPAPNATPDLNADLQASLKDVAAQDIHDALMDEWGDDVQFRNGVLVHVGNKN